MHNSFNRLKDFKIEFADKLVLVTGASRGIGRSIARAFADVNARLAVCSRNPEHLAKLESELKETGAKYFSRVVDVRDERAVCHYLAELKQQFGHVEILVNNAGIYKTASVAGHSTDDWKDVLQTNLDSAFFFCRELVPALKDAGWGRIINISSISGRRGEAQGAAYSASKFGMIGLTESLALELADSGVTVNAVCPGWVRTDMSMGQLRALDYREHIEIQQSGATASRIPDEDESIDIARMSIPQQRFIEPEEVADLVLFLSSQAAQGITGQAINICGGLSI